MHAWTLQTWQSVQLVSNCKDALWGNCFYSFHSPIAGSPHPCTLGAGGCWSAVPMKQSGLWTQSSRSISGGENSWRQAGSTLLHHIIQISRWCRGIWTNNSPITPSLLCFTSWPLTSALTTATKTTLWFFSVYAMCCFWLWPPLQGGVLR